VKQVDDENVVIKKNDKEDQTGLSSTQIGLIAGGIALVAGIVLKFTVFK
jgi:hypothetical protein